MDWDKTGCKGNTFFLNMQIFFLFSAKKMIENLR